MSGTIFWAARKSTVSRTAMTIALFRSSSKPVMMKWVGVSMRGNSAFMWKTGMKMVDPAVISLMSMLEPFFHGRMVLTGESGSLAPPLRGDGSSGSMPTASVPGKGRNGMLMPGLNSMVFALGSILK